MFDLLGEAGAHGFKDWKFMYGVSCVTLIVVKLALAKVGDCIR